MAKRAHVVAGKPAGAKSDSDAGTDVLDGRDALGNDRDDVLLEDGAPQAEPRRAAPNLDNDDDEDKPQAGAPPVFKDARDAIAAGYRTRRAAANGEPTPVKAKAKPADKPQPLATKVAPVEDIEVDDELEDGDQQDDGEAAPGEVVIIGKDGRVQAGGEVEIRQEGDVDPPARTAREAADPSAIPDDREVTMVVDNAQVRMTYGEMRRIAQQNLASESRLRQANDLLDRARRTAADSTSTRTDPGRRDQADPAPQETRRAPGAQTERIKLDPASVKGLVSRIQLGDDDDAAAALAEAISLGVEAGQAQRGQTNAGGGDVRSAVDGALTERDAHAEVNQALQTVAASYDDVIADDDYARAAYARAHNDSVTALRAIGVPEEDLKLPAMEIFQGYATLRQDPRYRDKLKPMTDVFVGAAEQVVQKFGLPERQQREQPRLQTTRRADQQQQTRIARTDDDRSGRKGRVTVQPRSSSVRTDFSGNGAAPRKTPAGDVVAGMAAARGQYTGIRQ